MYIVQILIHVQICFFFTRTVSDIQDKMSSENKIAYLIGDFNINLLNFATHKKI